MDYILLSVVIVLLFMVIFIIIKMSHIQKSFMSDQTTEDQKKAEHELKLYFQKEYGDLKFTMGELFSKSNKENQTDLNAFKEHIMLHIDRQMKEINDRVESRLGKGFEDTNKTFENVMDRLGKIDVAQKKIESLSEGVVSLNDLLTDKKTRGIYGEVQLYQLLTAVLGDNKSLYEKQKTLSNGAIVDAVIHAPDPVGMVAIDSKFPLDNYKRMIDSSLGDLERKQAEKEFKNDVKKHINDIKNKYIIVNETGDQAFMFVPAEAVFAEITARHQDLTDYASKHQVWLVSPTTLMAALSMIQMVVKNIERDEQAKIIIEHLKSLGEEFKRYSDRWDKLKRSIDSVSKSADLVHITSTKINKRFTNISEAKFDYIETDEVIETEDEDDEDTR